MNKPHIQISAAFIKRLVIVIILMAIVHHADHALRYDHSGWPFRANPQVEGARLVTPFSYSLLIYPLLISLLFIRNKAYRITVSTLLALFVVGAHSFVELPSHQYQTWAHNSSPYGALQGHPNVLNITSPAIGILAAAWSLIVDVLAILLPIAIWKERRQA